MANKLLDERVSNETVRSSDSLLDRVSGTVAVDDRTGSEQPLPDSMTSVISAQPAVRNRISMDSTRVYDAAELARLIEVTHEPTDSEAQQALAVLRPELPAAAKHAPPTVSRDEESQQGGRRTYSHIGGLILASSLVGVGFLAIAYRDDFLRLTQPDPAPSVVDAATGPLPQRIQLTIEIIPSDAKLFLDNAPASNPLLLAYPSDASLHAIRAEAPGYVARTERLPFSRDLLVVLSLTKAESSTTE